MKEYNTLDDFNVENKTVLLRVDFNMPLDKTTLDILDTIYDIKYNNKSFSIAQNLESIILRAISDSEKSGYYSKYPSIGKLKKDFKNLMTSYESVNPKNINFMDIPAITRINSEINEIYEIFHSKKNIKLLS